VLVTDLARQLAAGRNFRFASGCEVALKGLGQPLQLHALLWGAGESGSQRDLGCVTVPVVRRVDGAAARRAG
jgi:hypothetical protein